MIFKNLKITSNEECLSGGHILPSAFPYFSPFELSKLEDKDFVEIVDFFASALNLPLTYGEEPTCAKLDDNLFVIDFMGEGQNTFDLDGGISPYIIATIFSSCLLCAQKGEKVNLCLPRNQSVITSAVLAKLMGLPIGQIYLPSNFDLDGLLTVVDVSDEDINEYVSTFYQDFEFAIGIEDGEGLLSADVMTDGFSNGVTLAVCLFGMFSSPEKNYYALCGKKADKKTAIKRLADYCALNALGENCANSLRTEDYERIKVLCGVINSIQLD